MIPVKLFNKEGQCISDMHTSLATKQPRWS